MKAMGIVHSALRSGLGRLGKFPYTGSLDRHAWFLLGRTVAATHWRRVRFSYCARKVNQAGPGTALKAERG